MVVNQLVKPAVVKPMVAYGTRFAIGVVFGLGLWVSGMTDPQRIIGFLDVTGAWDPSLLFVMGSALAVAFVGFRFLAERERPVLAERFELPTSTRVDLPLIVGAVLFGAGWGISGYCPGPALASMVSSGRVVVFVAMMIVGMVAARFRFGLQSIRSDG